MRATQRIRDSGVLHPSKALRYVLQRFAGYSSSTSCIEQSFSQVAHRLSEQRLNATPAAESRSVGLLLANPSATELDMLCEAARSVWELAFPSSYRQHKVRRADRGIPKEPRPSGDGACPGSSEKLTERKFLKRCHAAIMAATPANSAALLDHFDAPASWSDRHTAELNFNIVKRRKRLVEARHST